VSSIPTTPSPAENATRALVPTKRYKEGLRINPFDLVPIILLVLLIASILILNPGLIGLDTLETKANAALTLVLVATGQTFPILTGGIDLSVGGMISLTNSLAATQMTNDPLNITIWVILIGLIGFGGGAINGFIVAVMRVTPFIATLATWSVFSGLALLVLESDGGKASEPLKELIRTNIAGIPGSLIIILIILGLWLVFRRTRLITQIYAVGSNEKGAVISGTNVVRIKILAYAFSGFFAAMAGLYRTIQVGSGSPVAGDGLILPSVAAVVIGGTSLAGGRGGVEKSIVGALIMLFINDVIFFAGVRTFYTPMVQGVLLVVAVAINAYGYRQSLKRGRE
jgi:ribose transport system permease protein